MTDVFSGRSVYGRRLRCSRNVTCPPVADNRQSSSADPISTLDPKPTVDSAIRKDKSGQSPRRRSSF